MEPPSRPVSSHSTRTPSRHSVWFTYAIIIVLTLLLVEGVVRVRQWWYYGAAETLDNAYHDDQKTGLRTPIPNYESRSTKINSLGFRGPEITVPKPPGTLRIAFLGGSTTYCAEASSNEAVWPHRVWQQLQEAFPQMPMDYVNAGIPGIAVPTSLKDLRLRLAPLQPDLLIIYHASNDMSWEARQLAIAQGLYQKKKETGLLGEYSLFWFLMEKNLRLWKVQHQERDSHHHLSTLPPDFGQQFGKNLTELVRESQNLGGLVALITWSQQMRADHSAADNLKAAASSLYYMPFMTPELLLQGFGMYNQIIIKTARETGSILIGDENAIPGDPLHFNDSIHFTDAGNKAMADRVAKALLTSEAFKQLMINKQTKHPPSRE
ncbi:MAG: SGNH/GDSL hydrolase family protein [Magnetococcales bacterium]|nr:SGNH/GDSL hydrolase family protein [Magnetococcales bacterium]